jgi:glycosyltransferase involved in cell wall biosynthesis
MNLSICIPSRNEMWLSRTVQDLLDHKSEGTEIIIGLDGQWADPPLPVHKDVSVVYFNKSIGQRAMTNTLVRISKAKYIVKVDAHCAFDQNFDEKLMTDMQDNWTVFPIMKNLHVFDWVCKNGHRRYQGPSGVCKECGEPTEKDVLWYPKPSPNSTSFCFDSEPHFQYFGDYKKRPEGQLDLSESMSLQGSFFMCTRDKYWELGLCDENLGSWGSQGIEVACKTWLSGGRVICNHKTWYAHLFRTQGGDFGFPYPQSNNKVQEAKRKARELFFNNKWDKATHPLSWLIRRFEPIPGWSEEDIKKLETNN